MSQTLRTISFLLPYSKRFMVTETMLKSIMMRSRGSISYHTSGYMLELRYNVCRIPKGFMYLTSSLFPRLYLKRSNHHNSIQSMETFLQGQLRLQ